MSIGHRIRCYDYVNHPYEKVRAALAANPKLAFASATKAAASRAQSLASELRIDVAGVTIAADIVIHILSTTERPDASGSNSSTVIELEWEAANRPHLFPFMRAELAFYPLTGSETQIDFSGNYEPPMGALGSTINALVGHRIAEGSIQRFVTDVSRYLRESIH